MSRETDTAGERIEGDRKVRVRVSGSDARAIQDAADYVDGPTMFDTRRRHQIGEALRDMVKRYRLMDESHRKAKGE